MKDIDTTGHSESRKNTASSSNTPDSKKIKKTLTPLVFKPILKSAKESLSFNSIESEFTDTIRINIGTLTGKNIVLDVDPNDSVSDLKERIFIEEGIAIESQMIVFCGKELKRNTACLYEFGIQDGSTLQLVLQMAGGPGPAINPVKEDPNQVIFLLCKQHQEMFVLEVHLVDGVRPQTVTKHHLRFQTPGQDNKLFDLIGSNECFDISDLCMIQPVSQNGYDSFDPLNSREGSSFDRPISMDSNSSNSFGSEYQSRSFGVGTSDSEGSIGEQINESYEFNEHEWFPLSQASKKPKSIRPATAISLMRLPSGTQPMIIIPKTRPSSAEKWIEGFKARVEKNDIVLSPKSTPAVKHEKSLFDLDHFESNDQPKIIKPKTTTQKQLFSRSTPKSKSTPILPTKQFQKTPPKTPKKEISISKSQRLKCTFCNKKLGPAQLFSCKCKLNFCSVHRYSDRHNCTFDYKGEAKAGLQRNNPLVKKEKLIRL